ncbi:MAG TPA: hypothetical protein VI389_05955 [Geobacteraceae bacterium]
MPGEILVHQTNMEYQGDEYEIRVFCNEDGRHFAKTSFSDSDVIINDGPTLHDALAKHAKLLPLAISSRKILRRNSPLPKRRGTPA